MLYNMGYYKFFDMVYVMYVMQMNRQWMYNADRRSPEFMRGVHDFLNVAKENMSNGFICCPCVLCKNEKD